MHLAYFDCLSKFGHCVIHFSQPGKTAFHLQLLFVTNKASQSEDSDAQLGSEINKNWNIKITWME